MTTQMASPQTINETSNRIAERFARTGYTLPASDSYQVEGHSQTVWSESSTLNTKPVVFLRSIPVQNSRN